MKMNLLKSEKLLAVMMTAFACICMWGCTDVDFRWDESRGREKVVGFVDDSLVIVGDSRCWLEIRDSWIMASEESSGCGRERLCVYNYRVQEDGPRWCDSLSSKKMTGIFAGQMTDSVIWGGEVSKSVQLWKIGEKSHEIKIDKSIEGCSVEFRISSLKQWFDGTFIGRSGESLAADGDTCNYAVLDTVARTLTYKRLDKELAWIKTCDDVRAWGDDLYCLLLDEKEGNSVVLKNANDSIFAPMEKIYEGHFSGNMIELGVRICSLITDEIMCSDVKWTGNRELEFYRNDGTVIHLK